MKKTGHLWTLLLVVIAVAAITLVSAGCRGKHRPFSKQCRKDCTKQCTSGKSKASAPAEHPKAEAPKSEHPKSEHPK